MTKTTKMKTRATSAADRPKPRHTLSGAFCWEPVLHSQAIAAPVTLGQTIRQCRQATFSRMVAVHPALIRVLSGEKRLGYGGRQVRAGAGDFLILPDGLPLTVENLPGAGGAYLAQVLAFPRDLAERAYARLSDPPLRAVAGPSVLVAPGDPLCILFEGLFSASPALPAAISGLRIEELILWLADAGATLCQSGPPDLSDRLRAAITADPAARWTAAKAAALVAMSEATLRRKLAQKDARFGALLQDVRMSCALWLLQSSDRPIVDIAAEVGYASPSRFAVRFRHRFGLSPHEIRA